MDKPRIEAPEMGWIKRKSIGTVCAMVSLAVLFFILVALEHFRACAPRHQAMVRRSKQLEIDLQKSRRSSPKR